MPAERIPNGYVHRYSKREHARLLDQATTLTELLHHDTCYPPGASVLEAGCDVGAQTVTLARNIPGARFISIDVSLRSLEAARVRVRAVSLENVTFQAADIFELPFPEESFDHVFVCFVLEHLPRPREACANRPWPPGSWKRRRGRAALRGCGARPNLTACSATRSSRAYIPMPAMPAWCAVSMLKLRLAMASAVGLRSHSSSPHFCTSASS